MDGSRKHIMTRLPDTGKVTLMTFVGKYKYLTVTGCILSGIGAVITLMLYLCTWMIIKPAALNWPGGLVGGALAYQGWMAVVSSLLNMLIYFGAFMYTHLSAFRTARNMKTAAFHHLAESPIGYLRGTGSGKLRRIIDDGAGQTETYLAHQLPDLVGTLVTPAAALVLFLVFDWRLGLISLIPMAVGTSFLNRMMGTGMAECMKQYQNTPEDMSSRAMEYVCGVPVVETSQQSIFSFESFHDSTIRYRNWVVNYTLFLRIPMCCHSVSINSISAVPISAGLLLARDVAGEQGFVTMALDLVFYILFTSVCVTMMDKIMRTSENTMAANDTLE